jgi:hypothetical protein
MYNQKNVASFNTSPTANIAVNRNRLKHYGEKIYLKKDTHFEIELFNPKTTKVLAKIYLDGIAISSAGVVINPGQRVFLERWLDEPRKFIFQTYDVEDSAEAKQAISENGKVKVEFYDQSFPSTLNIVPTTWTYTADLGQTIYGGTTQTNLTSFFSNSLNDVIGRNSSIVRSEVTLDSFETGRAEKGESSDQSFTSDGSTYNSWTGNTVHMQILPESQKPVEVQEIRNYCTNCGTRHKKSSWKFCPNCGTQI